nr:putative ribonuclease H-like domain-containing protein [Tanacetum cinerariifolium]
MGWMEKTLKKEKEGVDGKLACFLTASKDLDNLIESQISDKNKEGLGYSVVPPPPAQIYSSTKKDLSWTGLLGFADDTVTDYSSPSPTMESTASDDQNRNPSVPETDALPSTITLKPFIKFVKPNDSPSKSTTGKTKTPKKPPVKYAERYRKPNKKLNVRGNQKNWNNLKSHQLGPNFVMKKKACFNYGHFDHLSYDCRKRVKKGTSRSQNNTHESFTSRPVVHRPYRPPVKQMRTNMNGALPNRTSFNKHAYSFANEPFQRTSAMRSQFRAPWVPTANKIFPPVSRKFSTVSRNFPTVNRKFPTDNRKFSTGGTKFSTADMGKKGKADMCLLVKEDARLLAKEQSKPVNLSLKTDFKLLDDANILLRTPKQHNMYSINLNNIVPHKDLTCSVAKASANECMLWHKRLEFRNKEMNDFCSQKRIKREFRNARTPQQNGVAERRNMTLIEAARTMLVDA